jgi:hypothetical protein
MRKAFLLAFSSLAFAACDGIISPLDATSTPTSTESCVDAITDSTWTTICTRHDTTRVSVAWSQYYREIYPAFPHNGGGIVWTIVGNDTIEIREW